MYLLPKAQVECYTRFNAIEIEHWEIITLMTLTQIESNIRDSNIVHIATCKT